MCNTFQYCKEGIEQLLPKTPTQTGFHVFVLFQLFLYIQRRSVAMYLMRIGGGGGGGGIPPHRETVAIYFTRRFETELRKYLAAP